ncbi:MAG: SDR family oxidoreductase [Bernardetiaceae bacterium]
MHGKVVIITGGSSGIGLACAEVFGRAGARVVITGRNKENLEIATKSLIDKNVETLFVVGDVRNEDDNRRTIEATLERYGQIDILINNAGISMRAFFEDLDLSVLRQVMDINFWGTVYATKYALPHIIAQKGSIVGISSIAGYRGLPGRTGYSASKFAMQGFLEALRTELLPDGVHVLTACPGYTASNIRKVALVADGSSQGETPRDEAKMMTAEECAQHILRAVQQRKKILTLTTQGKLTVFLNKWFPGWMDGIVYRAIEKEGEIRSKK